MKTFCKIVLAILGFAAILFALSVASQNSSDYISVYDTDDDTPF